MHFNRNLKWLALMALVAPLPVRAQLMPATSYLQALPSPPGSICVPMPNESARSPDGSTEQSRFEQRVEQLMEQLSAEIASRSRIVKEANRRGTISPAQEAAMGYEGVDVAEAKANQQLTPKQRREAAMKKIEESYGISAAEIENLKKMRKDGNLAGAQGWGKAITAERQAGAAINPAKTAGAQKDAMETATLARKQSELAQRIAAALGKQTERFRELANSDDEKRLMAAVERYLDPYKREMQADAIRDAAARAARKGDGTKRESDKAAEEKRYGSPETCEARIARMNSGNLAQQSYCRFMTTRYVSILQDMKRTLTAHEGDYAELDRIQGEIARLQFGTKPLPEQQGLSMLAGVRDYAQKLSRSYLYKLTNEEQMSAANCGKLGF